MGDGGLEEWKDGRLERWKSGGMERWMDWKSGRMECDTREKCLNR
jgi:hypothetical protein